MGAWLKGDLAPLLRSLLSEESIKARGLFRYPAVAELIAAHEANRVDGTDRLLALSTSRSGRGSISTGAQPADVADELKALAS